MKQYVRVSTLCFAMMFGLAMGTAQAQSKTAEKTAHVYGTGSMLKPQAGSPESAAKKVKRHSRKMATSGKLKGEEFKSEAAAKAHCPTQTIVWVNTHGHIFHMPKSKYYGRTKYGAYACEKTAEAAGFRAAKR